MKTMKDMTAIIIVKNEEQMISACLKTLGWCGQILVIDTGSTDKTAEIVEQAGVRLIHFQHQSFARLRNEALKHIDTDWFFYIDADERVTPTLAKEIMVAIETEQSQVFSLSRQNIFLGKALQHGGWQNDVVTRIFHKSAGLKWTGKIHESPNYAGEAKLLSTPLIHFSHRDIASGLLKSAAWTPIEAELLYKAGAPTVNLGLVIRKGLGEFYRRYIRQRAFKDGAAGTYEAVIQGINRMLVYMQVWELQQEPSIKQKYQNRERQLAQLWKSVK